MPSSRVRPEDKPEDRIPALPLSDMQLCVEQHRAESGKAERLTLAGNTYEILSDDMMYPIGLRADGTPFPMSYRVTLIR